MSSIIDTLLFLLTVYWPFMAAAAAVGLVTGWLSLGRRPTGEGQP